MSCEVVKRKRDRYLLDERARRWLDPRSPQYIGGFIEFNYAQWAWWSAARGDGAHRQGGGHPRLRSGGPALADYIHAMHQLARLAAPEVASAIPLPRGAKHLLDLGGAHGWFSAELCQRHRGLKATVVDLEGSARVGREIIAAAGLSHVVTHREGDILTAELGGPYDAVLLFQVMHHLSPAQNVALLRRVRTALAPKGTLAVLEYLREEVEARAERLGPHRPALLPHLEGGGVHAGRGGGLPGRRGLQDHQDAAHPAAAAADAHPRPAGVSAPASSPSGAAALA